MLAQYVDANKKTLLFFASARNPAVNELPVGLLLHASSIRWAIEQGMQVYDLLRGDESYKYSLGATDTTIASTVIFRKQPGVTPRLLDNSCIDEALRLVRRMHRSHTKKQLNQLYAQLLESWPGSMPVLAQYANWLEGSGQRTHADDVKNAYEVGQVT